MALSTEIYVELYDKVNWVYIILGIRPMLL